MVSPRSAELSGADRVSRFRVLSDSPALDGPDPLDSEAVARRLEELVVASKDAAPFTVSIEAGWGAGKSTIMRRLERRFHGRAPDQTNGALTNARTVWFNAWTASEGQVLEGLVRSVLNELDNSILRRVARQKKLLRGLGIGASAVAGLLGVGNVVDRIWAATSIDPKQRNELNDLVRAAMADWLDRGRGTKGRMIVVFIDDLDRCTPATVIRVFEAMKLYLDAPGFVFVLGWDTEQVMRAVASERGTDDRLPHRYVEKIVQFGFRIPRPTQEQLAALTATYCDAAGLTANILSARHRDLLINTTNGNPRQLKRFLNRFILLHDFAADGADAVALILLLVLQSSYDGFYRLLSNAPGATDSENPLFEFADYVAARQAYARQNLVEVERVLAGRGYSGPDWSASLSAFERDLPQEFPLLAADRQFVGLLKLMSEEDKRVVRDLARSARLEQVEEPETHDGGAMRRGTSDFYVPPGTTVLWIDDEPKATDHALLPTTVDLIVATSQREAERILAARDWNVDLVISDIGRRRETRNAGLDGLAQLRRHGYNGPAIFYTMSATSGQVEDARKLDAEVTTAPAALRAALYRHLTRGGKEAKQTGSFRTIGADEAAEIMERGDVAPRRGMGTPRYGDRPDAAPEDARPDEG